MKTQILLPSFCILLFIGAKVYSQDYPMKPGEVITISEDGQILNTNMPATSKMNPGIDPNPSVRSKVNDLYESDGKPKIPGYKPTGIADVDEQNYKKAKALFYQNDPEGYKDWEAKLSYLPHPGHLQDIPYEEFLIMPEAKKQHIVCHPDKYRVVKPGEEK